MKYRQRSNDIEATPWNRHGDHPDVVSGAAHLKNWSPCGCGSPREAHGCIVSRCGGLRVQHVVCPGDFIVLETPLPPYPLAPDVFRARYELHDDEKGGKHVKQRLMAELCGEAVEALIWCSGSPEFQPEGYARPGWERGPQKVLDAWSALKRIERKE